MIRRGDSGADREDWPRYDAESGPLPPASGEIHVWRASLDLPEDKLHMLGTQLSPDERKRADRFRFQEHRGRFVAARGILRRILGIHLGIDPVELKFAYSEHGKPFLAEPAGTRLEFNLSHSSDLAIYAVAVELQVGVDVELIKPEGSWLRIAEHYFSAGEFRRLSKLPEDKMRREFFALWAEKEARLKARGSGLWHPLAEAGNDPGWSAVKLMPMPGYAAALAFACRETLPAIVKHDLVV